MAPIRLAVLGSGIFARDAHVPSLKMLTDDFEIVAIYSRNADRAGALAKSISDSVVTYTDVDELLAHPGIDAVDIILPIPVQPALVEAALKAGKHVISEKPVAPDVESGRQLLQNTAKHTDNSKLVWMVAENLRYEDAFREAGQSIENGEIGQPIQFSWVSANVLNQHVKYYQTGWRRDNSFPGGFLLDGGVHSVAAMRLVMGEVESVSAFVKQVRLDLPPTDTLSATLRFDSGAFGSFTLTFAAGEALDSDIHVIGDHGRLRVNSKELEVITAEKTSQYPYGINNIQAELADFARAIRGEKTIAGSPADALQDVAIIEAMLESARTGCTVKPQRVV